MLILLEALLFSLVLSIDSFSAAMALGFRPHIQREALRFAVLSGISEAVVTIIGFYCGFYILQRISAYDHWIAFAILFAVGLRMTWQAVAKLRMPLESEIVPKKFHSPKKVFLISLVTSIDALGIGLSLGVKHKNIWIFSPLIGIFAFTATLLGLRMAQNLSERFGQRWECIGGIVLMILSFFMLQI